MTCPDASSLYHPIYPYTKLANVESVEADAARVTDALNMSEADLSSWVAESPSDALELMAAALRMQDIAEAFAADGKVALARVANALSESYGKLSSDT